MDVDKMLAELRLEREQIEEAILTLERLARGRGRRRGRPPAWLKGGILDGRALESLEVSVDGANHDSAPDSPAAPKRRGRPPKPKVNAEA